MGNKRPNGYWNREKINEAFYDKINELRRVPTSPEFRGPMKAILKGRYDPKIKTWNGFLRYHGFELLSKPWGFYSNMTKEEWLAYGAEKGYGGLIRSKLEKENNGYYLTGLKKGWLKGLIPHTKVRPNGFYSNMTKEEWLAHGNENGYHKLSRTDLSKINGRYYQTGLRAGWLKELISHTKQKARGFFKRMNKEQWLSYGMEMGYDKISRAELGKCAVQYYAKGLKEGWIPELIPQIRQKPNGFWKNMHKEEWLSYGIERGYDRLTRSQLSITNGTYCNLGREKGWLKELIPTSMTASKISILEELLS